MYSNELHNLIHNGVVTLNDYKKHFNVLDSPQIKSIKCLSSSNRFSVVTNIMNGFLQ